MITDALTATNMGTLPGIAQRPTELVDDIVKEINAMNSWPDLDGLAAGNPNPAVSSN